MMSPARTVLLVEDEMAVARIARLLLESLGYRVIDAATAADALLRLAEDQSIDILFSDIVLPGGMNGLELAKVAMARRPDLKVLLASGYPRDAITGEDRLAPGMPLLPKPYRRLDLGQALDGLLAGAPIPPANLACRTPSVSDRCRASGSMAIAANASSQGKPPASA